MHSTSKTTCSDRTSATVRGSVMTSSGRTTRPQAASYRHRRSITGQCVTVCRRPEPYPPSPTSTHGSSGWGEAPLDLEIREIKVLGKGRKVRIVKIGYEAARRV